MVRDEFSYRSIMVLRDKSLAISKEGVEIRVHPEKTCKLYPQTPSCSQASKSFLLKASQICISKVTFFFPFVFFIGSISLLLFRVRFLLGFLNIAVYPPFGDKTIPDFGSPQNNLFLFNFRRNM